MEFIEFYLEAGHMPYLGRSSHTVRLRVCLHIHVSYPVEPVSADMYYCMCTVHVDLWDVFVFRFL
jgi:hypothetical protein